MFSTLICIFGNTYLNYRTQASLISAYAVLDKSYKEYIANTKELYGDDADREIKQKIANSHYDDSNYIHREDKKLFFEFQTMRYLGIKFIVSMVLMLIVGKKLEVLLQQDHT